MPKVKVKRCIRPQCSAFFSIEDQNDYCDCGAVLNVVDITVKDMSENRNTKNNHSGKKQTTNQNKKGTSSIASDKASKAKAESSSVSKNAKKSNHTKSSNKKVEQTTTVIADTIEAKKHERTVIENTNGNKNESDREHEEVIVNKEYDCSIIKESSFEESEKIKSSEFEDSYDDHDENEDFLIEEEVFSTTDLDDTQGRRALLYLLLDEEDVEFVLSDFTRIGRTSDGIHVDIDLSEYAGKDISREHAVIKKEGEGYFITNVSKNHSVRIVKPDGSEKALEYGRKELLLSEDGILLSKKILLQFMEEN